MKNYFFQLVFSTYLHVYSLKFRSGALIGWGIRFCIQRVPTQHTFRGPWCPKNEKYTKKCDDDEKTWWWCHHHVFFMYFSFLGHRLVHLDAPKTKNTWKMWWWCHHHIFHVFLIFRTSGFAKRMSCGYSLDAELNSPSNKCYRSKLEWIHKEICRK